MVMSEDEKKLTAYHESGHAIVGLSVPDHDPVYTRSTIIPAWPRPRRHDVSSRGRSLQLLEAASHELR